MSFTVLRARALLIVHHFKDVSDCVHWWSLFLFQCQSLWPDWTRSQSNICLYISDGSFLQLSCSSHSPPSLTCRSHSHALHSAPAPSSLPAPDTRAGARCLDTRDLDRDTFPRMSEDQELSWERGSMNQYLCSDTQRLCLTTNDCVPCVPCVTHLKSSRIKRQAVIFMSSFYGTDQ